MLTYIHIYIYAFLNKKNLKKLISLCIEYNYSFLLTASLVILIILPVISSNTGLCSNCHVTGPPCYITPQNDSGYLIHLGTEEWVVEATALYLYPHTNAVHDQTLIKQKSDLGRCWHLSGLQCWEPHSDINGTTACCGVAMHSKNIHVWTCMKTPVLCILIWFLLKTNPTPNQSRVNNFQICS